VFGIGVEVELVFLCQAFLACIGAEARSAWKTMPFIENQMWMCLD
jgi:hypothetical protein